MTSVRLRIVDAVAAKVQAATGRAPFRNLDFDVEERNAPYENVASGEDGAHHGNIGARAETSVDVEVAFVVAQSTNPEAATDATECAVHAALLADTRLGGLAKNVRRLGGKWEFDLGDCCRRTVAYRVDFGVAINNLEAVA